jgi:hypothetical protein
MSSAGLRFGGNVREIRRGVRNLVEKLVSSHIEIRGDGRGK